MAISKLLIASLLVSLLLVLSFAEADDHPSIVAALARPGASYHRGHAYARGHVGLAVHVAAVFLLVLPVTMMPVPATPA
ncbi:conserved hypothetical protein [Ricinus communis]|uniref:Uncharacterized protein n=1 Tax=Ricinus communis TaxID=3988 RepID=B9R889_RICCO|nr:conserved hypothetical protein [Ricinus communis]